MQQAKWIIFDADNTLWNIEVLYDSAREKFCQYVLRKLEESGGAQKYVSLSFIEQAQRHRDLQLYASLGYSSGRFARSFEDTLNFLMPAAQPDVIKSATKIALDVFDQTPVLTEGLENVLLQLETDFKLAIITAGEEVIQKRRLEEFRLREHFKATEIVSKKTADVFDTFCKRYDVDRTKSWVIGDSIRSDILPAVEAGLKAVHIKAPNWAAEDGSIPSNVISIERFAQILEIVR